MNLCTCCWLKWFEECLSYEEGVVRDERKESVLETFCLLFNFCPMFLSFSFLRHSHARASIRSAFFLFLSTVTLWFSQLFYRHFIQRQRLRVDKYFMRHFDWHDNSNIPHEIWCKKKHLKLHTVCISNQMLATIKQKDREKDEKRRKKLIHTSQIQHTLT